MLIVENDKGRKFGVRVVLEGDNYGSGDCLTHENKDPIIEFYDYTYCNSKGFGDRGQFCSCYYLSTLVESGCRGICLHGAIPEWTISENNKLQALRYAFEIILDKVLNKETHVAR